MRRERVISLQHPKQQSSSEYYCVRRCGGDDGEETRKREGSVLTVNRIYDSVTDDEVTLHREATMHRSCHVEYAKLHNAVEIVHDEAWNDAPWENDEYYTHQLKKITVDDQKKSNSAIYDDREWYMVILDEPVFGVKELLCHYQAKGASRQVAAEMVAQQRRKIIKQIVAWRIKGWSNLGAVLKFNTGIDKYKDSIWGFYTEEDATESGTEQVLSEVIARMEADGYIVTGQPTQGPHDKAAKRQAWLSGYKFRASMFNWSD